MNNLKKALKEKEQNEKNLESQMQLYSNLKELMNLKSFNKKVF